MSVAPGTLARSVDILASPQNSPDTTLSSKSTRRIALVHHVPFAFVSEFAVGSILEEAFLNTNHAKMYLAINTVAIDSCVVGKSNMYRRSDLERVNGDLKPLTTNGPSDPSSLRGLAAFGRFLAEDNMIASAIWHELGLRHDLSCDTAGNAVGNMSFMAYIMRRIRWIRVRKHMVMAATLLEPFTECVVLSIMAAWALHRLVGIPSLLFLLVHYVAWIAVDLDVYSSLAGHPLPPQRRLSFLWAWALRESLALPIWIVAIMGDTVTWRGKTYEVLRNGEVKRASLRGGVLSFLKWGRTEGGHRDYEALSQDSDGIDA